MPEKKHLIEKARLASQQVNARIKEANLYLEQGLLREAIDSYRSALDDYETNILNKTVGSDPSIQDKMKGEIGKLQRKIHSLEAEYEEQDRIDAENASAFSSELAELLRIDAHGATVEKETPPMDPPAPVAPVAVDDTADSAESNVERGAALIAAGAYQEGIEKLRIAISLYLATGATEKRLDILEQIAQAHNAAGETRLAAQAYAEILSSDPRFWNAHQYITQAGDAPQIQQEARPKLERKPVVERLLKILASYHLVFLFLACCVAVTFSIYIPSVRNVEDVDHFILPDDPDNLYYEGFKETFGNDEFFLIAFQKADIFLPQHLSLISDITGDLAEIEEIREVESLSNADFIVGGEDFFEVREFLDEIPEDPEDLGTLKKQATTNPLYLNNFISADARTTAIVVSAFDRPEDDYYRSKLVTKVKAVLDTYKDRIDRFYLAGKTITDTTMSAYMEKDMALLVPASYLLITLTIFFFYRNFRLILLAVVNISLCLACTMGFFGMSGITQNSVTSIVIPLVMALSLCDTVHIFSHLDKRILGDGPDRKQALIIALKPVVFPCFITTLTTVIGFLSLSVSKIPPIREFAFTASVGLIFEFFFSFFLLPPLLLMNDPKKIYRDYGREKGMPAMLSGLCRINNRFGRVVIVLAFGLLVFAIAMTRQVEIDTNVMEFFRPKSAIRQDLTYVEKALGGVESLDISLRAADEGAFTEPEFLSVIENLQTRVKALAGVDVTLSFVDFLKDMNRAFHNASDAYYTIPDSRELVAQYLLLYDADDIEDFINNTRDEARISIRISEHNSSVQKQIIEQIRAIIGETKASNLEIELTGRVLQDVNVINDIFWSQIYSLALAIGIIWGVMFFVLKSVKLGLVSLVPNVFPLVFNFGIMGIFGIPLNTATALIAAVAIGIAVDDTIHFMNELIRQQRVHGKPRHAMEAAIHIKGRAIITSSIILCCGFGILGISSFVPTVHFGVLCAGIMVSAIIGDLILLPAILLHTGIRRPSPPTP